MKKSFAEKGGTRRYSRENTAANMEKFFILFLKKKQSPTFTFLGKKLPKQNRRAREQQKKQKEEVKKKNNNENAAVFT